MVAIKNKFKLETINIPKKLQLRDYQKNIIAEIKDKIKHGENAIFVQSSPGSGKTLMMSELVKEYSQKYQILSIAHRQEIIKQTIGRYVAQGANYDHTTVAMVQTATRHLKDLEKPKLIIIDEAHHAMAKGYLNLLEHFNDPDTIKIYFSATPWRADGKGFTSLVPNENLICGPTTEWLIEHHYLAPYTYYQPKLVNDNLLKFSGRSGDFTHKSVQSAAKSIDPVKLVDWYEKLGNNMQGIVYAASIESSEEIVKEFNKRGISAFHLDGASDKDERNKIIDQYKQGKIKILSNVEIFTEGLDLPNASIALIARPTMSLSLYLQFSMRVLRYQKNKHAVILDFAGNAARLGLPSHDFKWSLRPHDIKRQYAQGLVECPHCKRIFDKKELIINFHPKNKKNKEPYVETICPYCQKNISVEILSNKNEEETKHTNEVAKKYLDSDEIVHIKNKDKFELYWLASKDLDTASTLDFNFRVLLAKVKTEITTYEDNSPKALIKADLKYFYDNILNVHFDQNEIEKTLDLAEKYNQELEKPYPAITLKDFKEMESTEKEIVEEDKYLATPITYDNPLGLNIKVAKVQANFWQSTQPYYQILFNTLLSKNKAKFISYPLNDEINQDVDAISYYKKLRFEASKQLLTENQFVFKKAYVSTFHTGQQGLTLFMTNSTTNKHRKYHLISHKYNHYELSNTSLRDAAIVLYGNNYSQDDLANIMEMSFKEIADTMYQKSRNNHFLIVPNGHGESKLIKMSHPETINN